MKRLVYCLSVCVLVSGGILRAADPPAADSPQSDLRAAARASAARQRRDWLLGQLEQRLSDRQQLAAWQLKIAEMSDDEIQRTASQLLDQLAEEAQQRGEALLEAARRDQARHREAEWSQLPGGALQANAPPAPGFYPVIAWFPGFTLFPSGISLTVSAVALPGGHLRVTTAPIVWWPAPFRANAFLVPWGGLGPWGGWWGFSPAFAYGHSIHVHFGGPARHWHGHHVHRHPHGHVGRWNRGRGGGMRPGAGPRRGRP